MPETPTPPALTAEEWGRINHPNAFLERDFGVLASKAEAMMIVREQLIHPQTDEFQLKSFQAPETLAKIIAACNTALPEDSRYKITHSAIGSLDYAIQSMLMDAESPQTPDDVKQDARECSQELAVLQATLRALLPP